MSENDPLDAQLDPEMQPIVEAMRKRMAERTPMIGITPAEMRKRAAADFAVWNENPPSVASVQDITLDVSPQSLSARLYAPSNAGDALLVHFHGGGWVIGDLDTEDRACRIVAARAAMKVLSVDYRLSPETKFPDPMLDCVNSVLWARSNAGTLGVAADKIAIGGASAGANLAMGAALRLRDMGEPPPPFLALIYGAFAMSTATPSYAQYGNGRYGLGAEAMEFFMNLYLAKPEDRENPYASPAKADLRGMPPAFLSVAGMDPLRDDSFELAAALRKAGVTVELREYAGVIHGFTQFSLACAKGRQALEDVGDALKFALA